jgi:TonB-linked SusC/RagA family outer membrane protein
MLFLLVFLFTGVCAWAQTSISGVVRSETDGETMPGVSVTVQGTALGTVTDIDGNFSISIPSERAVLVFTYIGYQKLEISVTNNSANLQIVMKEDTQLLDEVVVVGYGTMKRSDLSGASVSLGEDKIKGSLITNIDQALQGRASGVTSVMTSGAPGSAVSVRVRGQATINAGAEPLYVIDGVIWQGGTTTGNGLGLDLGNGSASSISPLSTLNPGDIVSMEILKDASATAIYGAQGANGVILITTKRGKEGKARFTYEGMFGVQNQVRRLDIMNLREYATYSNALMATTSGGFEQPEYSDPSLLGAGTNWQDAVFRTALMNSHNISAQGGSETVKYFVSGSYMDQEGTIIGTDFKRYSFRVNLDAKLNSWLTLGLNAMYADTEEHLNRAEGDEGVLTYSLQTPPDIPIYDIYGNYASTVREGYTTINPIAIAQIDENLLNRQKLNGNFFVDIKPLKQLTLHSELDYDIGNTRSEQWKPTYDFGVAVQRPINHISLQRSNNLWWALKNYLTYNNTFGKHHLTAMVGQEAWESNWEWQRIIADNLPGNEIHNPKLGDPDTQKIDDGMGDTAMASFFTRETYNYDDRYLLTYTFRYDGSSSFGPKNRWAPFHSVAGAWRFSNELFLNSLREAIQLSNGKLRIGWGQTGNSSINGGLWDASLEMFPTGLGSGYKQAQIANPYVQWETQNQWNIGLDLGFFNDRLNLVIDAYDKTANNLLMELQLPTYFGSRGNANSALTAPMGNFGTINNKGLEISINSRNIDGRDFKWSTDFQISFNKNKLVALQGTDASGIEGYGQWSDVVCLSPVGGSLYQFYGYIADGVYKDKADIENHLWGEIPENGYDRYATVFAGDIKYRDLNNDGKITTDDRTFIGSPLPKFTYGFNNTFIYKNFDLNIFIQGSYGNKVFNALDRSLTGMGYWSNQLTKVMDFANIVPIDPDKQYPIDNPYIADPKYTINNWYEDIDNVTLSNPQTNIPRAGRSQSYNNARISTRYIEDGSYLRLKNIALGYNLPTALAKKWQFESVRIYMNVQNLLTLTKYTGYDPEVGINPQDSEGRTFGFDQGRYPAPRTISFGLNISF